MKDETRWSKYVKDTAKEMEDTRENREYARKLWDDLGGDTRVFTRDADTGKVRVYVVKGEK